MEPIRDFVSSVLPTIGQLALDSFMEHLIGEGVESLSDLRYLTDSDLMPALSKVQSRKLISSLTTPDNQPSTNLQQPPPDTTSLPQPSTSALQPPASASTPRPLHPVRGQWTFEFQTPWSRMPATLANALREKRRPSPSDRRFFVRLVVDCIQEAGFLNPTRGQLGQVAQRVVNFHPESFSDISFVNPASIMGCGYASLLNQMKARVEHQNRGNPSVRRRTLKRPSTAATVNEPAPGPAPKKCRYGSVNWQPEHLPEGQTEDSLRAIAAALVDQFATEGYRNASATANNMATTYIHQRRDINAGSALSVVKDKWPFLFVGANLFDHFETLMGFAPLDRLCTTLEERGSKIIKMFQSKGDKAGKDILLILEKTPNSPDEKALVVVRLILAFFNEKESALLPLAGLTDTHQEVVDKGTLSGYPQLIVQGSSLSSGERWMVSAEGELVSYGLEGTFVKALATLFSTFYIFNMEYPADSLSTMDFMQRFFFEIIVDGAKNTTSKGTSKKSGQVVSRKNAVSQRVATLLKMISDFEWGV